MSAAAKPTMGYFTRSPRSAQDNSWHLEPGCPDLAEALTRALSPEIASRAATSTEELTLTCAELGRRACTACTYDVLLDELARDARADSADGYHTLECAARGHGGTGDCAVCQTLTRYANRRRILNATTDNGHVSLLRDGTLRPNPNYALAHAMRLLLDGTATRPDLPAISAPVWAAAATLVGHHDLTTALSAALGLLAPPPPLTRRAYQAGRAPRG